MSATTATKPTRSNGTGVNENPLLAAALAYAAKGWAVVPLHTPDANGKCSCGGGGKCLDKLTGEHKGKHPRTLHGLDDATRDLAVIRQWWSRWPDANIGLACGQASGGALAFDFDSAELFPQWRADVGVLADGLVIQKTGKGFHAVLRCDDPGPNTVLAYLSDGKTRTIETRGEGGYIMAAPSLHPNGKRYKIVEGSLTAVPHVGMETVDRLLLAARKFDKSTKSAETPNPLADLVRPAHLIAKMPPHPVDWLTQKFIERGELVLLTAPGGHMKSLLILDWAVCVAAGLRWLTTGTKNGGLHCAQAPVLWLNTDNGEPTHNDRLRAMLAVRGLADVPLFSITTTEFELAKPEHIAHLELVAHDLGAAVIVIDTLSGALTGIDENSAKEMTAPAAHLRALASGGRTVIGLHHPPKNDVNGSRGSSVLPNKVDRVYTVNRADDLLTVKPTKVRNTPPDPITAQSALEFDAVGCLVGVRFFDGNAARKDRADSALKARVREALDGEPEGLSFTKLRDKVKCNKPDLRAVLFEMRQDHDLTMTEGARHAELYKLA